MNQVKQEPWESSPDFQDYQWTGNSVQIQAPQYSPYFNSDSQATPIKVEADEENLSQSSNGPSPTVCKEPKKRGRPKKIKEEGSVVESDGKSSEKKLKSDAASGTSDVSVGKKKRDRFNGMTEDEVLQRHLPDHLAPNLDILIVGINPGMFAAYVGHHYAGPGNHFWKCLHLSGLIPEPMSAYDDYKLIDHGIGFTNICARTTKGSADLKKQEIKDGADILRKKLALYKPKIAVFNGKGIYEVFSGNKNFHIGKQPDVLEDTETILFVMPSSSARCAQLPRAVDKVPFYVALKKLRDHLKGDMPTLDDSEVIFPNVDLRPRTEAKEEAGFDEEEEDSRHSGGDLGAGTAGGGAMGTSGNSVSTGSGPGISRELTVEQIQMQAEYLEALAASAEGKDISADTLRSRNGNDLAHSYSPQVSMLDASSEPCRNSRSLFYDYRLENACGGTSIKLETDSSTDSDYGPVSITKPRAEKVNLDSSVVIKNEYDTNSEPQYMNLGDIPSKKKKPDSSISSKSNRFPQSSTNPSSWIPTTYVPSHSTFPGFPFGSQSIYRSNPHTHSSSAGLCLQQRHFGNNKDIKPGNFLNI